MVYKLQYLVYSTRIYSTMYHIRMTQMTRMKYISYGLFSLICILSVARGMDGGREIVPVSLQVHDDKGHATSIFLTQTLWEKVIAVSSCKNVFRLVNRYLHTLASWSNREMLIPHSPLSLTVHDAEKIAFELVEKDDIQKTKRVLNYLKKRFKRAEIRLSPCGVGIWHRAKS